MSEWRYYRAKARLSCAWFLLRLSGALNKVERGMNRAANRQIDRAKRLDKLIREAT